MHYNYVHGVFLILRAKDSFITEFNKVFKSGYTALNGNDLFI